MSDAREVILARIRSANATGARGEAVPTPSGGTRTGSRTRTETVALFCRRVEDYRAHIEVVTDPVAAAREAFATHGATRVGIAPELPAALRPTGVEVVEDRSLSPFELDGLDGALTTCEAACAETGTIALAGRDGQGRRALTLVPDLHVCIVRTSQIVETVPELIERLSASARLGRPIVLVSGPSATSDIELSRVEGVHGPRRLVVLVVEDD